MLVVVEVSIPEFVAGVGWGSHHQTFLHWGNSVKPGGQELSIQANRGVQHLVVSGSTTAESPNGNLGQYIQLTPMTFKLDAPFFRRPAVEVARDLLGTILVRRYRGKNLRARIVE